MPGKSYGGLVLPNDGQSRDDYKQQPPDPETISRSRDFVEVWRDYSICQNTRRRNLAEALTDVYLSVDENIILRIRQPRGVSLSSSEVLARLEEDGIMSWFMGGRWVKQGILKRI